MIRGGAGWMQRMGLRAWIGLRRRASRSMSKLPWKPPALTSYFVAALRTDLTTRLLMLPSPPRNLSSFWFAASPTLATFAAIVFSICSASFSCSEATSLSFSRTAPIDRLPFTVSACSLSNQRNSIMSAAAAEQELGHELADPLLDQHRLEVLLEAVGDGCEIA